VENIIVTLLYWHADQPKCMVSDLVVIPENVEDVAVAPGCSYDMISVRLSVSIFMNAPVLSFVHYMHSMMMHTHDTRKLILSHEPCIIPSFHE
jgi:hypothetical protein